MPFINALLQYCLNNGTDMYPNRWFRSQLLVQIILGDITSKDTCCTWFVRGIAWHIQIVDNKTIIPGLHKDTNAL